MTKIRIGVKVKGKWTYRRYTDFTLKTDTRTGINDLNLFHCIQNAAYWAYYKTTGTNPQSEATVCVDAITVSYERS